MKQNKIIKAWAYIWEGDLYSNGVGNLDIYGSKKQAEINSTENQRERAELKEVEIKIL